ncbi:MAG TPA: hypothetical protein PK719_06565 [Bacteroidales bacterium]|nr:hypothetical protein [Bacteroidales bacterium]HOU01693.1 hypothetical protein [Bacteroidales bacterium]HQG63301.1 hypothetical protein [Bacteroidales bacterium]
MPKPNPGQPGDDKNKHGNNEPDSNDPRKTLPPIHAYGHAMVILIADITIFTIIKRIIALQGLP